jgi:hypothetical protein
MDDELILDLEFIEAEAEQLTLEEICELICTEARFPKEVLH